MDTIGGHSEIIESESIFESLKTLHPIFLKPTQLKDNIGFTFLLKIISNFILKDYSKPLSLVELKNLIEFIKNLILIFQTIDKEKVSKKLHLGSLC